MYQHVIARIGVTFLSNVVTPIGVNVSLLSASRKGQKETKQKCVGFFCCCFLSWCASWILKLVCRPNCSSFFPHIDETRPEDIITSAKDFEERLLRNKGYFGFCADNANANFADAGRYGPISPGGSCKRILAGTMLASAQLSTPCTTDHCKRMNCASFDV